MDNPTYDEIKDRVRRKGYRLGEIYTFGEYTIAEQVYIGELEKQAYPEPVMFYSWVGKDCTNNVDLSFDAAILRCLSHKHLGLNSDFTMLAARMLGIEGY